MPAYVPPYRRQRSASSDSSSSSSPLPSPSSSPRYSSFPSSPSRSSPTAKCSGAWRTNAGPLTKGPTKPDFANVKVGQVFFFPPIPQPETSIHWGHIEGTTLRPWGHPMVITNVSPSKTAAGEDCVFFRAITSFGDKRLEESRAPQDWNKYLLADNDNDVEPQPGGALAMMAPGSGRLPKRSYVVLKTSALYCVEYRYLDLLKGHKQPLQFDDVACMRIRQAKAMKLTTA